MSIIDISPLISEKIANWPEDVPFTRQYQMQLKNGDNLDLSSIKSSLHLGSHADAPSHYVQNKPGIDQIPLEVYYGLCQVIEININPSSRILPSDLNCEIQAPRILFRTGSFPDPCLFNQNFNSLSPELIKYLSQKNVILVGLDTPSVDPYESKLLESHHALNEFKMYNLEGLVLEHVTPGLYTICAFPLKIENADASPVRAVLITI